VVERSSFFLPLRRVFEQRLFWLALQQHVSRLVVGVQMIRFRYLVHLESRLASWDSEVGVDCVRSGRGCASKCREESRPSAQYD
jgi:hypothetical protein